MKNRMGTFNTTGRVENHVDRKKSVEVPQMLVDMGAEFTWIDGKTLKKIGVKREKKDYTFVMANGKEITRAVGFAIIHVGDAVTIDEVIFGEPGDLQILGARSLEGMNLRVDSRAKKLVAGGPILAAAQKIAEAAGRYRSPACGQRPMKNFELNKNFDDGLGWLRRLRRTVAKQCNYDLAKQSNLYHHAAARHSYKPYQGNGAALPNAKRLRQAA